MSFISFFSGAVLALSFGSAAVADIEIHDPYARSSNAMAGAAFMVIYNRGDNDDRLLSVVSRVAARTQLHTHLETADGVMHMQHVEGGFAVPAGAQIALQRGENHVMFMGLNAPFKDGEAISITLVFENAGEVVVEIPIDQDRTEPMDHSTMDHGDTSHDEMDHGSDG